jgi:hypothetical protein
VTITAPHFAATVVLQQHADPIVGYMRYWSEGEVAEYCERRRWKWRVTYNAG